MRIAVFGAGGVGGYFGGRLAQAGEEVVFIARGDHLRAMQANGLRVDSIKGDFIVHPVQATDDPKTLKPVEMILVAVKSWQVPEAAEALKPLLDENTGVVFLGNGVEAHSQFSQVLGALHILGGLTFISASIAGPGWIRHVGIEPVIVFGELDGRPSERVERLKAAFERAAGLTVTVSGDVQAAIWEKFIFIASISGVGAVTRAPAGAFRSLPESRRLLEAAIAEVTALARCLGVRVAADIEAKTLAFIDGMAPTVTASMQRDILDGRPSELEAQNGAVVRLGAEAGVQTPVHSFLYGALLPQEQKARGQISF